MVAQQYLGVAATNLVDRQRRRPRTPSRAPSSTATMPPKRVTQAVRHADVRRGGREHATWPSSSPTWRPSSTPAPVPPSPSTPPPTAGRSRRADRHHDDAVAATTTTTVPPTTTTTTVPPTTTTTTGSRWVRRPRPRPPRRSRRRRPPRRCRHTTTTTTLPAAAAAGHGDRPAGGGPRRDGAAGLHRHLRSPRRRLTPASRRQAERALPAPQGGQKPVAAMMEPLRWFPAIDPSLGASP